MKLTNEQKDEIRLLLQNYVARYPSQNKAANSLVGISAGTLSTILNGRYETACGGSLPALGKGRQGTG